MTDFHARWKELARAAARAEESNASLAEGRLDELAALARTRVLAFPSARAQRRWETRALLASAVLLALIVGVALHDAQAWSRFSSDAAERLASLPDHVPSAPRLPSPSHALDFLPDLGRLNLGALVRPLSIDVETSR